MFKSNILTSTIAAAALLLAAAPALAEESKDATEPNPVRPCCERVKAQVDDRAAAVTERGGAPRDARQPARAGEEDWFQQRPYWNGP